MGFSEHFGALGCRLGFRALAVEVKVYDVCCGLLLVVCGYS